ncbi:uncharacterized protein LOC135499678 [Lineus longissimus]|uniref:uncharacterized protein LOC135499678 n=1 Tax=Lineus longissimus TaxID=88925 RepID=UPI00315C6DC6
MNDMLDSGHASKVPQDEVDSDNPTWYIPHFGVVNPEKNDKVRIVFDCSARYKDTSLNDNLLQGPDLTNSLLGGLMRFRQEPVALQCDIKKMFLNFRANPEHRDMLRFLWWPDGYLEKEPTIYRMNVHLFGATSSPGCANFALRRMAEDYEDEFGSVISDFVKRNYYMDDGIGSTKTDEEAIGLFTKNKAMCGKIGLELHKVLSNSPGVMQSIAKEDLAQGVKDLDLSVDTLPIERTLGVFWCIEKDIFQFRITLKDRPFTRRGVLATIGSVYDPLGMAAPVVLVGKRILQELCADGADWDDPLPENLRAKWGTWRSDLLDLEHVSMPRCYKPQDFGEPNLIQLHHFSDASQQGLGQCSFLRMVNPQGQVHCSYVVGKARVTPIKTVTMPRLELTAAVMSAKASVTLGKELDYKVADELFWTDSQIVLGYIANEARRFGVFVANRVQQIKDRTETEQWKHVRGEENPADEGSRGLTVEEMKESKWLKGPGFLWEQELPKNTMTGDVTLSPDDPEVRKACVHAVSAEETGPSPLDDKWLRRFSSLGKAKRILALCLSFIQRCRNKAKGTDGPVVNVAALEESERVLVRIVQNGAFEEEIQALKKDEPNGIRRTSPLYHLDPYLDKEGIVRLGGRLRRAKISHKHPIILPKKSQLGKLVAYHRHEKCAHGGRGMTINEIRANGYWILGIRTAVSPLIHRCVRCRKARRNVETPKMADLPVDRIEAGEGPFECCALDIFGPWTIWEKRSDLKRYGMMITCLAVRAVHIETLNSMTTDSFINALRRFCAIRGPCRLIRSDRGSNIAGADMELRKAWEGMDHEKIRDHLLTEGVDYHYMMPKFEMSFPKSSHMNGAVERQIRTVRAILNQLLQNRAQQLDDEAIRTLMAEAMAIVNCRP